MEDNDFSTLRVIEMNPLGSLDYRTKKHIYIKIFKKF